MDLPHRKIRLVCVMIQSCLKHEVFETLTNGSSCYIGYLNLVIFVVSQKLEIILELKVNPFWNV